MKGYRDMKTHYLVGGVSAACGLEDWSCGTRGPTQVDCIECRKWLVSAVKKGLRFGLQSGRSYL